MSTTKSRLKRKLQTVIDAVEELFSDTSVNQGETLEALEEIQSQVESKIDALKSEMDNGR